MYIACLNCIEGPNQLHCGDLWFEIALNWHRKWRTESKPEHFKWLSFSALHVLFSHRNFTLSLSKPLRDLIF